jgi:hypothetical protein
VTSAAPASAPRIPSLPWQIWVVFVFLALDGIQDIILVIQNQNLYALVWVLAKCLFITGLALRWRWVAVLFVVFGALHVFAFATQAPFIALLNLVLVLLVASAGRFYFPARPAGVSVAGFVDRLR